jgi:hypothetical protein
VLKFGVKTPINAKDPKKKKNHLIFINFGVKKFTLENTPKKKTLTFECYNLLDFFKFSYFFW